MIDKNMMPDISSDQTALKVTIKLKILFRWSGEEEWKDVYREAKKRKGGEEERETEIKLQSEDSENFIKKALLFAKVIFSLNSRNF